MKRISVILLCFCFFGNLTAQNLSKPGGRFEHVINVASYSDWGKGYLTITDAHIIGINDTLYTFTFDPITNNSIRYVPVVADIILEVNGTTTKDMKPEEFYAITDTATAFTLKFRHIANGKEYVQKFAVVRGETLLNKYCMIYFRGYKEGAGKRYSGTCPQLNFLLDYSDTFNRNRRNNDIFHEVHDTSFDFSKIRTYDYVINSNDPLNDLKILEEMKFLRGYLTRDTLNPDILFTIAKSADESITSTYIPPTSRTINTGSYTTSRYNYFRHNYDYETRQTYRTINEGGYTETTKSADIFLEISALDAKRINDKSMTHAPIIWQMTVKRHVTNYNFNIMDEYHSYASWALFPIIGRYGYVTAELYEKETGIVADKTNPSLVKEVKVGSRAEEAGIQAGDEIIQYEYHYCNPESDPNRYNNVIVTQNKYKYETHLGQYKSKYTSVKMGEDGIIGWLNAGRFHSWHSFIDITIKRNGQKIKVTLRPRSKTFSREYL